MRRLAVGRLLFGWWLITAPLLFAAPPQVDNARITVSELLASGQSAWRLNGLALPSQQTLDLDFEEVYLYAPDAAWLRPTPDGFERLPRERLRVFVGTNAASPDGLAVLIERDDGRLQGSWENGVVRYELEMGLSDAAIRAVDRPAQAIVGNPFEADERRPPVVAGVAKALPMGRTLPFDLGPYRTAGRLLAPGQSVQLMGGVDGKPDLYRVSLPAGTKGFRVEMNGESGDADLYVIDLDDPDTTAYRCAPRLSESKESCLIRNPNDSGDYLLAVHSTSQYGPLSLDFEVLASLAAGQLYGATIAIDTDYELVEILGSVGDVQAYVASLFAYLNVTYESEISTRLLIGDQIIPQFASDDPYDAWEGCSARLGEVRSRYANNTSISRALLAHFSPSGGNCGVAYSPRANAGDNDFSGVLCDASYGLSVNNIRALAPGADTPISSSWDAIVAAHEIGHNFSSPHSHCYGNLNGGSLSQNVNPVDACYTNESSGAGYLCAEGTASLPGSNALTGGTSGGANGSIMSYCHLLGGGLGNTNRTFGQGHDFGVLPERVAQRMSMAIENASALSNSCISVVDNSSDITLSVQLTGAGSGSVSSDPSGIACGADCSEVYLAGTSVTLTATPEAGSVFAGWGGACSGLATTCQVTTNQSLLVTASFADANTITPLQNGVATGALAGARSSNQDFSFAVSAGTSRLEVTLAVGTGDPDIFVDVTYPPVTNSPLYDSPPYPKCSSVNYPEDEICVFENPAPGTYYIRVNGWTAFSGAVLTATTIDVFTVTPSAGANGTISPTAAQTVTQGSTLVFNLTPNTGYRVATVGGTCPGTYQQGETTYSAGPITANCSVEASFEPDPNFPLPPSITSIMGSAEAGTVTVSFTPNPEGGAAQSYTASCTPVAAEAGALRSSSQPEPHISKRLNRDLVARHASGLFQGSGLRCGAEHKQVRHALSGNAMTILSASQADCSLSQTVISDEYGPLKVGSYIIPVYFHVMYTASNQGWIPESRIKAQMTVLNEDFGAIFNTSIRFELAGITYTQNDDWFTDSNTDEQAYKSALGIDQSRYLNVYTNDAGGYLGYATFPAQSAGSVLDGVVNLHSATGGRDNGYGNFDQGRTLVHEIGHYLGLWHTFQGNGGSCANSYTSGDYLLDTTPHGSPDYGCTARNVCGTTSPIENFMNYSDDQCMDQFTDEQSNRMVCSLINYRPNLFRIDGGGVVVATATESPLTLSGLELKTNYQCSLVAINSYGKSASSSVKNILLRDAARTPTFATPSSTVNGFTVQVSNYDVAYGWAVSTTEGSATISVSGLVTVTGLTPAQSATVTVSSTRTGYFDGTGTVSGSAMSAALTPTFATPSSAADGFTVQVSNYDVAYGWAVSTTEGSATISVSGLVTVTGLTPAQSATVTVSSTRTGYFDGTGTVSGSAMSAALTPTFATPSSAADGFTVQVSNYDVAYGWAVSTTEGSATISVSGLVTVTGLTPAQSATVTVSSTRTGYFDGTGTVSGSAMSAALTPTFATPSSTVNGFTVQVSNYDVAYGWAVSTTEGSATISVSGLVTVTGLTPAQSATVTVSSTRTGYFDGTGTVSGSAMSAALTPTFATPSSTVNGFTVQVSNYDVAYGWAVSTTEGSATISVSGLVIVTGLTPAQSATVTVSSTRTGYFDGTGTVSASAAKPATEVPAAPVLSRVEVDDGVISIYVTPGGEITVTDFEVSCTDGVTTHKATGRQPLIILTGLTNGVAYTCKVVAENSVGRSSESVWTSSITPESLSQGLPIWLLYEALHSPP